MRKSFKISISSLVLLALMAFGNIDKSNYLDQGQLTEKGYSNSFLGFDVPVERGWWLNIMGQVTTMTDTGFMNKVSINKKLNFGEHPNDIETAYLVQMHKYNPNLRIKRANPTMTITIENLAKLGTSMNQIDSYLKKAKELMINGKGGQQYTFIPGYKKLVVDGVDFAYMDAIIQQGDQTVRQRFISTFRRNFAVSFVLAYASAEDLPSMMNMVRRTKLKE